jgi:hypothetical protein
MDGRHQFRADRCRSRPAAEINSRYLVRRYSRAAAGGALPGVGPHPEAGQGVACLYYFLSTAGTYFIIQKPNTTLSYLTIYQANRPSGLPLSTGRTGWRTTGVLDFKPMLSRIALLDHGLPSRTNVCTRRKRTCGPQGGRQSLTRSGNRSGWSTYMDKTPIVGEW